MSTRFAAALPLALFAVAPAFAQAPVASTDPSAVKSGSYTVDPHHTQVEFGVSHMGFSRYNGRLSNASGTLVLDAKTPTKSKLTVSLPVDTISTTSDKLDGELKSKDWLDATAFPTATFESTSVVPGAKGTAKITGNLTMHGVTKPVTLTAQFVGAGVNPLDKKYTAGFAIDGEIKRSDFGVKTYVPLIGDAVHLTINGAFEEQ